MIINGTKYDRKKLGKLFDYAMLNHDVTREQIKGHVAKAIELGVWGVHCNPCWTGYIADMLDGTGIETGIIPAFPFGADDTQSKVAQIEAGCKILHGRPGCVDSVGNVGLLRGGELAEYTADLKEVVRAAHEHGYKAKIILETPFLTDAQIADACKCAVEAGADFIKTASGRSGVTEVRVLDVIRANIPQGMPVKLAGMGTSNLTQLTIMGLAKGASVFGTGFAHIIIDEIEAQYADFVVTTC